MEKKNEGINNSGREIRQELKRKEEANNEGDKKCVQERKRSSIDRVYEKNKGYKEVKQEAEGRKCGRNIYKCTSPDFPNLIPATAHLRSKE